jgi:hypothetical protein
MTGQAQVAARDAALETLFVAFMEGGLTEAQVNETIWGVAANPDPTAITADERIKVLIGVMVVLRQVGHPIENYFPVLEEAKAKFKASKA